MNGSDELNWAVHLEKEAGDGFEGVRELIRDLDRAIYESCRIGENWDDWQDLPEDVRFQLMVLGSSMHDTLLWVRRAEGRYEGRGGAFICEEVESGGDAYGRDSKSAIKAYLRIGERKPWTLPRRLRGIRQKGPTGFYGESKAAVVWVGKLALVVGWYPRKGQWGLSLRWARPFWKGHEDIPKGEQ